MRALPLVAVLVLYSAHTASQTVPPVLYEGAALFAADVEGATIPDSAILVEGSRIAAVGRRGTVTHAAEGNVFRPAS